MRRTIRNGFVLLMVVVVSWLGFGRLSFETDLLEIFPAGVKEIEAYKIFRSSFSDDHRVTVLVGHEEEVFEEEMEELATWLEAKMSGVRVEYRSRYDEGVGAMGASLAAWWSDADADRVNEMVGILGDEERLKERLAESRRRVELAIDQEEATRAAYDPLGLLGHPAVEQLRASDFGYQSEDGKGWLLVLTKAGLGMGYQEHAAWVGEIRESLASWDGEGYQFGLTGGPVSSMEVGLAMEQDLRSSVLVTGILVGLLFLWVQRSLVHLVILSLILGLVFLMTLGIFGWVGGSLNLVSVGFAAILLGLVIDYGVVMAREAGHVSSRRELRVKTGVGIGWAALTTAVVFGLFVLSSFRGVQQLGILVMVGLAVGATTCVVILPWVYEKFPPGNLGERTGGPFLSRRWGVRLLILLVLGTLSVFAFRGSPSMIFDLSTVEPKKSEAVEVYRKIQEGFPAWSKRRLTVVSEGATEKELRAEAERMGVNFSNLRKEGILGKVVWASEVLPNGEARERNREKWDGIAKNAPSILAEMEGAGVSEKGRELTSEFLKNLASPPTLGPLGRFFCNGKGAFTGTIEVPGKVDEGLVNELQELGGNGTTITGWAVIQMVLLPMVQRDFYFLALPAIGVLLLALGWVFRRWQDALMTAAIVLTALLVVNALVVVTGKSWNFLSSLAIPLIVGTGIDYAIHLVFALRRHEGDLVKVWNGVGKAICFCGVSTVIGFGSLVFASSESLQEMGILCGAGVFVTMSLTLLVVPRMWRAGK